MPRGGAEMVVHDMGPGQKFLEAPYAAAERDAQADRRPQGETPPHPVPEFKHLVGVDAEGGDFFGVGGDGNKMGADGVFAQGPGQPVAGRFCVGQGFLGGEGLGDDNEQRRFRIKAQQGFRQMGGIDVGDMVDGHIGAPVGRQGLRHHGRTEVGPADADVDDVGKGLARVPGAGPAVDGPDERPHFVEDGVDRRHDVFAINPNRRIQPVAERPVEDGAVFRCIDRLAVEETLALGLKAAFPGQGGQQVEGFGGQAVLGKIQQQAVQFQGQGLEAARLGSKQTAHVDAAEDIGMCFKSLPGRRCGQVGHGCNALLGVVQGCQRLTGSAEAVIAPSGRSGGRP